MSKIFSELTKEAHNQQSTINQQNKVTKLSDVPTPTTDVDNRRRTKDLQSDKLQTIIKELSEISVTNHGTPVRLSSVEKHDIEDYIFGVLRKKGLSGKSVGVAKLMRYSLRYLMKVHEKEFTAALIEGLKKEEKLSI